MVLPIFTIESTSSQVFVKRIDAFGSQTWYSYHVGPDGKLAFGPVDRGVTPALQTLKAHAIYGAFSLLRGYYIAFATEVKKVAMTVQNSEIFQILRMDYIPVLNETLNGNGVIDDQEESLYLSLLQRISDTQSFYFSSTYDLTLSLQRFVSPSSSSVVTQMGREIQDMPSWVRSDPRFFWNRLNSREIIQSDSREFFTPIINGFVGSGDVLEFSATLTLVTRRSCARQGTRFNVRGSDQSGNVANYAETEQLIQFGDGRISSYVQIRGSIPLIWDQLPSMKYTPRCTLGNRQSSTSAFQRHFDSQLPIYNELCLVNLIDKKKDQKLLGTGYDEAVQAYGSSKLKYVWFDFHAECKNMKWHNLGKLVKLTEAESARFSVFQQDAAGTVVSLQRGVIRTNCMDNLDRTNVAQSIFARAAALSVVPGAAEACARAQSSVLTSPFPGFERVFNNLWADNADAVSRLYSGTGALKTDFTRTGKRTMAGALSDGVNSLTRYVLNNLCDGRTQDAWDLFTGRYVPGAVVQKGGSGLKISPVAAAHLGSPSLKDLVVRLILAFAALTGLSSSLAASLPGVNKWDQPSRFRFGLSIASLGLSIFMYLLLAKGLPIGKRLVNRPTFSKNDEDDFQKMA